VVGGFVASGGDAAGGVCAALGGGGGAVRFCAGAGSLTPWIFVAMVAGAEIGFDAPRFAVELRVFSDIFLRLIKTIVAPLILATLITGIAGHGDMKSVGRMAWKSIVYFEVITTLALVIGLVAINLTKAGVGLAVPTASAAITGMQPVPAQHWQDFVLHVFPREPCEGYRRGADFAGVGLCGVLRDCARVAAGREALAGGATDGEPQPRSCSSSRTS